MAEGLLYDFWFHSMPHKKKNRNHYMITLLSVCVTVYQSVRPSVNAIYLENNIVEILSWCVHLYWFTLWSTNTTMTTRHQSLLHHQGYTLPLFRVSELKFGIENHLFKLTVLCSSKASNFKVNVKNIQPFIPQKKIKC